MKKFDNPDHVRMCEQCPWRRSNHGKRHKDGFYTKKNLRRLWAEIKSGGGAQTCHLTDPSHPMHVAAGAPLTATPHECAGSLALVSREIEKLEALIAEGHEDAYKVYRKQNPRGLTQEGFFYWIIRIQDIGNVVTHGVPTINKRLVEDEELVGRYE